MSHEPERENDVRSAWQNQKGDGIQMSVEQIRLKAGTYRRRVSWRNAREYFAAVTVIVFLSFNFVRSGDVLTRLGFGMVIAAMVYLMAHLYRRGSWRSLPEHLGVADCLEFHRAELERQRDLLRSVWRWYLGPMVPGFLVLMAAMARNNPGHLQHLGWIMTIYIGAVGGAFVFVWRLNEKAARRLQQRIDELDALREPAD